MTFKAKQKGSAFEADAVEILNEEILGGRFRRVPGSGALGTTMGEPLLTSDISGRVEGMSRRFKIEAKCGYNSSTDKEVKQFTLKKEWLDKVAGEASNDAFATPLLIGKFSGARKGVKVFVAMDVKVFAEFINEISRLQKDLDKLTEEK